MSSSSFAELAKTFELTCEEVRCYVDLMSPGCIGDLDVKSWPPDPKAVKEAKRSATTSLKTLLRVIGGGPVNARHSKETGRWGTPVEWVARACAAQGVDRIGLDPMSEEIFQSVIRAWSFFTEKDDCFSRPWVCNSMLINPAGGHVVRAWRYLVQEWQAGRTKQAVWIGFSVEQLNLLASEPIHPDDFCKLMVRKRISFTRHDGYEGAPGHANYVVGVGVDANSFMTAFEGLGRFSCGRFSSRPGATAP